mmetsp:Transcript_113899/g.317163  ORF Transcript_113899/g.317163 Transcript_113899/m.317163 type:complete len:430 (-) Transcript_113899:70-1359(-)
MDPVVERFGEQIPFCEPYWYQGYPSAYYKDSHRELRKRARDFVEAEVKPYVDGWIASPEGYPRELHARAFAAGLPTAGLAQAVKCAYPPEVTPVGGWDSFHELVYLDEIHRGSAGMALGQLPINSMALPPLLAYGAPHLRALAEPVMRGEKWLSLAISEPLAGSDVAGLKTTAEREAGGFRVNGQKKWISGGMKADYFTVAVRTGGPGHAGISLLLVDGASLGLTRRKMPMQFDTCHNTAFLTFDDVFVPENCLIGQEGQGFRYLMDNFNHERFVIAIEACRKSRLCYEESIKYAMKRKTFGKALAEQGVIRLKLAEMARSVESLYDNLERVAFAFSSGVQDHDLGGQCSLLKVNGSRTFEHCAREAAQIFGGNALVREGQGKLVERLYREVRWTAIPGGSEEIMLDLAIRQALRSGQQKPGVRRPARL